MSGTKLKSRSKVVGSSKSSVRSHPTKPFPPTKAASKHSRAGDHLSDPEEDAASEDDRSPSSDADGSEDDERQAMLAMLEAHGRSFFGDTTVSAATNGKAKGKGKAVAAVEDGEEVEEWVRVEGLDDSDSVGSLYDEDDELDDAGELDDEEDLLASALSQARTRPSTASKVASTSRPAKEVVSVVFQDPSRSSGRDDPSTALGLAGRKAFMAAQVNKPIVEPTAGKKRKTREEEEDESHLKSLDRSLASLITTFNSPSASSSTKLHSLLSTNLSPPSVPSNPLNPQSHGRRLRASLAASHLSKLRKSDEEARLAGTVRGKGTGAASLRERKRASGEERKERKERRGIGGVWGKERGGSIRLSKDVIAKVKSSSSRGGGGAKGKGYRRK